MKNTIKTIVSKIMNVHIDKITEKTNLFTDLKADSLDMIEIAMAIEEKFKIDIPDSELEHLNTIDLITKYIQNTNTT
ncbi:acyl carrier protein [Buchnera aphidicola (Takecallis taiwana)]|uniref:acyl carrier protein n=1 Tax=Buchnera aphidicola TaxID=9 RepID=UPI0031B677CE